MASRTLELPRTLGDHAPPASASLPVRLAATAMDLVVVGTVVVAAGLVAHLVLSILPGSLARTENIGLAALAVIIASAYFIYFWGIEGATPGKKLMGLTVTRPGALASRRPIGLGRAFVRLVGITVGNILFVDTLVAFLHRDRRALHDLMADSIVMEVR